MIQLLLIGVHLRKTGMIDVMVMSGQTTYRTIDDQIADLLCGTWTGMDACAQHQVFAKGRAPAEIGKLRVGTVQDFARDVYMLSRADVLASCEWSSIPEVVRMVKGKPFRKDCTPRTGSP